MKARLNKLWFGALIGLVGTLIGFFVFVLGFSLYTDHTISYVINAVFLHDHIYRTNLLTVSILFNVLLFFVLMRFKLYEICKGILLIIILSVPVIIYLG